MGWPLTCATGINDSGLAGLGFFRSHRLRVSRYEENVVVIC